MSTIEEDITQLTSLCLQGDYRMAAYRAIDLARAKPALNGSALFALEQAVIASLVDETSSADRYRERASEAEDFDPVAAGDFLRDTADQLIRAGRTKHAARLLTMARTYHDSSLPKRRAAIDMVEGYLRFRQGHIKRAVVLHQAADDQFMRLGVPGDDPWVQTNRYHLLRALAAQWPYSHRAQNYAKSVLDGQPRSDRTLGAWLARTLGWPGIWLDDQVTQYRLRHQG